MKEGVKDEGTKGDISNPISSLLQQKVGDGCRRVGVKRKRKKGGSVIILAFISSLSLSLFRSLLFVHSDLISVEGSIRVISDEFSISLLNPESEAYRFKETKYSKMVRQFE